MVTLLMCPLQGIRGLVSPMFQKLAMKIHAGASDLQVHFLWTFYLAIVWVRCRVAESLVGVVQQLHRELYFHKQRFRSSMVFYGYNYPTYSRVENCNAMNFGGIMCHASTIVTSSKDPDHKHQPSAYQSPPPPALTSIHLKPARLSPALPLGRHKILE